MEVMDWYDRNGVPMTFVEYIALMETVDDNDYRRIDLTEIGPYVISTVWLGLDHNFTGEGPAIIFETMVFTNSAWVADRSDPDRELLVDIDTDRYATEEEARAGHEAMVLLVRATTQEISNQEERPHD